MKEGTDHMTRELPCFPEPTWLLEAAHKCAAEAAELIAARTALQGLPKDAGTAEFIRAY